MADTTAIISEESRLTVDRTSVVIARTRTEERPAAATDSAETTTAQLEDTPPRTDIEHLNGCITPLIHIDQRILSCVPGGYCLFQ